MDAAYFVLSIIGLGVTIPLAGILTSHKRRMAEINNANRNQALAGDADERVLTELRELRQLIHEQAIAIDNLADMQRRVLERSDEVQSIRNRINS